MSGRKKSTVVTTSATMLLKAMGRPSCEIRELLLIGTTCWPDISISEEQLLDWLEVASRQDLGSVTKERAEDLYLACACALGDQQAISAFESRHRPDIDRALEPMALPTDLQDEVRQAVRMKLFVPKQGAKIQKYSGRGSLAGWVRAVAVRTAIDTLRREKTDEVGVDQPVLEALAEADVDPDIRAIKQRHRDLVNQAFEMGFVQLSVRQRNLLRQHYIHQLNIEQLGAMYKIHRATAFRWIAKARAEVFRSARDHVSLVLREEESSAEELLRLLQSQVDVTLERLLRTQASTS